MDLPHFNKVIFRIGAKEVTAPSEPDFVLDPSGQGNGTEIWLTLEGAWTMKAGIEPDVNTARVPWNQWDKLGGNVVQVTGQIEFWFGTGTPAAQTTPDHTIKNITLVHAEATGFGTISANGTRRITEYRLFFADRRHWWMPPRGGHLNVQGVINGPADTNPQRNTDLVQQLLIKLGVNAEKIRIDAAVNDDLPKLRNLEWRGKHPREALREILDELGLVLSIHSDGEQVRVDRPGEGPTVMVPVARDMGVLRLPGVDRRGKTIVFQSGPVAVIETDTLTGPDPGNTFEFVVRKKDTSGYDQWITLEQAVGSGWATALRDGLSAAPASQRARMLEEWCRFVRIVPTKRKELFRSRFEDYALRGNLPSVTAKVAQRQTDGSWKNSASLVDMEAVCVMRELPETSAYADTKGNPIPAYIIALNQRAVRVTADGVMDLDANSVMLADGEMELRASFEKVEMEAGVPLEDENGKAKLAWFSTGFMLDNGGTLTKLTGEQLSNALLDRNTLVVRDERILVEGGVGSSNQAAMEAEREKLARRWLRGSGEPPQRRSVIGFLAVELSGKVAQIQWDQANVRTDFDLNTWHLPTGLWSIGNLLAERKAAKEKYPGQAATADARMAMGGSSSPQPSVLLTPSAAPPARVNEVVLKVTDAEDALGETKSGTTVHVVADRQSLQALAEGTPKWILGVYLGTKTTVGGTDYQDVQVDAVGWGTDDYMVLQMNAGTRVWDWVRAHE